ncbi:MFS transporter [Rivihabitans pingtungensis]|uniref:MFS transporter n=1 Tax=Rivihabitans pingtungensis TaxID=1054498 RepID=UPI00235339F9|nr:MFS transporter [Rivihabitans pingtungensis]MCK6437037.1 MFS transporter [Rivihabitans pingtungensis]
MPHPRPAARQLWPFAGFYFCYFSFVGVTSPYWGLYLASLGLTPWAIAVLASMPSLARVTAPGFWGWLADRHGQRRRLVRLTTSLAALSFAGLFLDGRFAWLFAVLALAHFFWAAPLPLVDASVLSRTADSPGAYSRVRLWGSIGFVVMSLLVGYLLEFMPMAQLPWVVLATLLGLAAFAWRLPDTPSPPARHSQQPFMATLRQPVMRRVYLVTVLMAVAHGPYYAFYSIGLKAHGWQASQIGWLWTLGVLAEITAFWWMPRILARVSLAQLLRFGLLMAVLRFAVIAALPDVPAVMMAMQLLHAFTFATHHTASIGLLHQAAPPEHQAKSQGLYWVLGYGLGGGIGGLAAGALWPHGQMLAAFGLSCAAALLGWLCALRWPTSAQQARAMPRA